MKVYTTEITSDLLPSDNPVHQRLLMPYYWAKNYLRGDVIEPGCGEGRGIPVMLPGIKSYLGLDKNRTAIEKLKLKFPDCRFIPMNFPPLQGFGDNTFDSCISLQVIEHIRDDEGFVREIFRVLKPGGMAMITTPNRKMSLTRNPWHIREYDPEDLTRLVRGIFGNAEMLGITGNEKVMNYYEENRKSVNSITRFDILKLQYRLPAAVLKIPYELMNRLNRNRLKQSHTSLVSEITYEDYVVTDQAGEALDLLCLMVKK